MTDQLDHMENHASSGSVAGVLEYKCPCCGAGLTFGVQDQKMTCAYCDTTFDLETVKAYNATLSEPSEEAQWDTYDESSGNGDWKEGEAEALQVFICPSCGGEIMTDRNTAATFCPYCENPAVLPQRVGKQFRPDFVIPFQKDKAAAQEAFRNLCKGKFLLPKGYASEQRLEKISGIYVPFWLYSCDVKASARYNASRIHTWSDSKYIYTRTDHFLLDRSGSASFDKVPVDGSEKMDNDYMEGLEPFDYSQAVDFETAYLSGYLADKYDVSAEQGQTRATERITATAESLLRSTTAGYTGVIANQKSIIPGHASTRYVLLPVWMLNSKYKDKVYTFAMNGQTGKIVGKLPVSTSRCLALFGGLTAALSLLFILAAFI